MLFSIVENPDNRPLKYVSEDSPEALGRANGRPGMQLGAGFLI